MLDRMSSEREGGQSHYHMSLRRIGVFLPMLCGERGSRMFQGRGGCRFRRGDGIGGLRRRSG